MQQNRTIRCAIYTRKSTEEGLEQDYNSLHAQRDACAAYVMSQAGEGWTLLPEVYDDGGYSGGNMDRPALTRLMAEIEAKKVDVVVVYKVDRLTRSLADFSKIVEVLDRTGASFVSVTQAFNTTTSMGRLTLNVLLSFAQFEREVTGERIRDKIAASKKKGLWMGGPPVLGYEPDGRTLRINTSEADDVRWMFERYADTGSVSQLVMEMARRGMRSKQWTNRRGEPKGGLPIERGAAYHMLRNPIYVGEIPHKNTTYPGQHAAIIERTTFDAVQEKLADRKRQRKPGEPRRPHDGAPLTGLIFDSSGNVMSPVSASRKGGATYRYYVSTALQTGRQSQAGIHSRVAAPVVEQAVLEAMSALFTAPEEAPWKGPRDLIERIVLHQDYLEITLDPARAQALVTSDHGKLRLNQLETRSDAPIIRCPLKVTKRGALAVIGPNGATPVVRKNLDPALASALVRAEAWKRKLMKGDALTIDAIAKDENLKPTYAARMLRVAFLAPDLKQSILDGVAPSGLTLHAVMFRDLPLDWEEQKAAFAA